MVDFDTGTHILNRVKQILVGQVSSTKVTTHSHNHFRFDRTMGIGGPIEVDSLFLNMGVKKSPTNGLAEAKLGPDCPARASNLVSNDTFSRLDP